MLKEIKEVAKSVGTIITVGVLTETSISWLSGTSGMVLRRNLINTTDDCYLKPFVLMHSLGEVQLTPNEKAGVNTDSEHPWSTGWYRSLAISFDILKMGNLMRINMRKFQWGKKCKENNSKPLSPLDQKSNLMIR